MQRALASCHLVTVLGDCGRIQEASEALHMARRAIAKFPVRDNARLVTGELGYASLRLAIGSGKTAEALDTGNRACTSLRNVYDSSNAEPLTLLLASVLCLTGCQVELRNGQGSCSGFSRKPSAASLRTRTPKTARRPSYESRIRPRNSWPAVFAQRSKQMQRRCTLRQKMDCYAMSSKHMSMNLSFNIGQAIRRWRGCTAESRSPSPMHSAIPANEVTCL